MKSDWDLFPILITKCKIKLLDDVKKGEINTEKTKLATNKLYINHTSCESRLNVALARSRDKEVYILNQTTCNIPTLEDIFSLQPVFLPLNSCILQF